MTSIEYLSMPKSKRILYKIGCFFKAIPMGIYHFFKKTPQFCKKIWKKIQVPFVTIYEAMRYGDWKTRISFAIFGFGQLFRKEIAKGILLILFEIAFIAFMILVGGPNLAKLGTLGTVAQVQIIDPVLGIPVIHKSIDNSFKILLYSIITILLILLAAGVWYSQIKRNKLLQDMENVGKYTNNMQFVKDLSQREYHKTLLAFPTFGLITFTIIPIIFMVLISFTHYDSQHLSPFKLFDWVGFQNYENLFGGMDVGNNLFLTTFLQVVAWTLIWAFFATFSNYFLGMIVAILINTKGIKLKKLWRTVLVTTIAVPQFISLLLISKMLSTETGVINNVLKDIGMIKENIEWLEDPVLAKVMIILVNTWVGVPYTMLICTGLLMNIPEDLYESAKIDGASPFKMYMKITLPYMLFVTTPYLISQFVGNINNFNVIYLLSGGAPLFIFDPSLGVVPKSLKGVGQTDLLITWIYKMSMTNDYKDYGTASVISIMIFLIVATLSLIFYSRSNSVKNEEDFQ